MYLLFENLFHYLTILTLIWIIYAVFLFTPLFNVSEINTASTDKCVPLYDIFLKEKF